MKTIKYNTKVPEFLKLKMDKFLLSTQNIRKAISATTTNGSASQAGFDLNLTMNHQDYLGIYRHPEILKVQRQSLNETGSGSNMSAVFQDTDEPQQLFETKIAEHLGMKCGLLCQSGYNAHVGLMRTIAMEGVAVYMDEEIHESFHEGARFAGTQPIFFKHNDLLDLAARIKNRGNGGILVVSSLYESTGTVSPLREIVQIANRHELTLVVDESQALGIFGPEGRGLVYEAGLTSKVHFITASFSGAFVGQGGIILSPTKEMGNYLRCNHFPIIFSSAVEPQEAVRFSKTLDIVRTMESSRKTLRENSEYFRAGLRDTGYDVEVSDSHIIDLTPERNEDAIRLNKFLKERGISALTRLNPATDRTTLTIRLFLNSGLNKELLDYVLDVCEEFQKQKRHDNVIFFQEKTISRDVKSHEKLEQSRTSVTTEVG